MCYLAYLLVWINVSKAELPGWLMSYFSNWLARFDATEPEDIPASNFHSPHFVKDIFPVYLRHRKQSLCAFSCQ